MDADPNEAESTPLSGKKRRNNEIQSKNKPSPKKMAATPGSIKKTPVRRSTKLEVSEASQGVQPISKLKGKRSKKLEAEDESDVEFEVSQPLKEELNDLQRKSVHNSLSNADKIAVSCLSCQLYRNEVITIEYTYLFPAEGVFRVRKPTESAIEQTIQSLINNVTGLILKLSQFFVILIRNPETDVFTDPPKTFSELKPLLVNDIDPTTRLNPFKLVVICGNHRLLAIQRINAEKKHKLLQNVKLMICIYYNLDQQQIISLATLENTISHATNPLTIAQQVEFIYTQWNTPGNITKSGKLKKLIKDVIIKNIIRDKKFKEEPNADNSSSYNSNNPFINACRMSPTIFNRLHKLIEANVIKKQLFIDLVNLKNEETIFTLIKDITIHSKQSDLKDLDNQIKKFKWTAAIWQALKDYCALKEISLGSDKEYSRVFGSRDQLYCDFGTAFVTQFKKSTLLPSYDTMKNAASSRKVVTPMPSSFVTHVTKTIERYKSNKRQANYKPSTDYEKFLIDNNITKFTAPNDTVHFFFDGNAVNDLYWRKAKDLVNFSKTSCSLIILDPPFGILEDSWDKNSSIADFEKIFSLAYSTFPNATFIIFHSDKMLGELHSILTKNDFKSSVMCSYFTSGKPLQNYFDSFAYLAQFYTMACKSDKWKLISLENTSNNTKLSSYMRTNFRIIDKTVKTTDSDGAIINPSEKSVPLLRSLIALFCLPGDIVIDPMCGSGSTAEACLSLKINSISFDIRPHQVSCSAKRLQSVVNVCKIYPPVDAACFSTQPIEVQSNLNIENLLDAQDDQELEQIVAFVNAKCQYCDATINLITCDCNLHSNCPIHQELPCRGLEPVVAQDQPLIAQDPGNESPKHNQVESP